MKHIPAFIQQFASDKDIDSAAKAKLAMEGIATHPEEREYTLAWAAGFMRNAGQYDACIEHCKAAIPTVEDEDPRYALYLNWIWCLQDQEKLEETIPVLEEMLLKEEDNRSSTLDHFIATYEKLGDEDNMIRYMEMQMADVECADEDEYTKLAELHEKKGNWQRSAELYERAATDACYNSAWLWTNAGRALALAGKESEAEFYFKVALKILPEDAMTNYMMGQVYQNRDDVYRAMHHYMIALKTQPEFPEVYNNLAAIAYNEDGNISEAVEHIEKALSMSEDPKMLQTLYLNLARLYHKIAEYDKHEYYKAKWAEALGLPPGFVGDLTALGDDDYSDEFGDDDDDDNPTA